MNKEIEKNIELINREFAPLLGMEAWNVELGQGSFVLMDFGRKIEEKVVTTRGSKSIIRGEWHFWVYMAEWDVYRENKCIADDNDERETLQEVFINYLKGKILKELEVVSDTNELVLEFDNGAEFCTYTSDENINEEQWYLYTPNNKVLTAGPGTQVTYQDSSS